MSSSGGRTAGPPPFLQGVQPKGIEVARLIVCGTRDFRDYGYVKRKLDRLSYWFDAVEVVIGSHGQRKEIDFKYEQVGADALGKRWAEWNWWTYKTFWADWERHGKSAGPRRNKEMADYVGLGGYCAAFWDGKSPGTKNMIDTFRRYCDPENIKVYRYK